MAGGISDDGGPREPDDADELRALIGEQAQTIAHYGKMFERTSAMAKIGVWECELPDNKLSWTDAVYDLFELPRGSPVERPAIIAMYDEDSRRRLEEARSRAIREGSGFALDLLVRTALGNDRWIRLTADVEMENGGAARIFGTKQDVTEEKAAQEKLQLLQTELIHLSRRSAMVAMADALAHELNQPLTAIANYVAGTRRALERGVHGEEMLRTGFEAIEQSALKAGGIIRSLRAMSSGRTTRRETLDPNPLIREAGALVAAGSRHRATLRYVLAGGVSVRVDPVQIQQVVINLLKNAVDAVQAAERREVMVTTTKADGRLMLCVEDSGPGIAVTMLETMFDSFVSSKPAGTGIGLAIARTIVEGHDGKILAANRPEGGASFTVLLPLADAAERGGEDPIRLAS